MSTQITLTLPDEIYRQVEHMAQKSNRPVRDILTDTILQAFPPFDINQSRATMQQEISAFEAMHADLLKKYTDQYIAVFQGEVIDHDPDELTLVERIDQKYSDVTVLIRQVQPQLPEPLAFRSPRFVKTP